MSIESSDGGSDVVAIVLARSAQAVQDVMSRFASAGFTVGPASGPVFAVWAPRARYRETFGAEPVPAADGGWTTEVGDEFPLDRLPEAWRREVTAVALERPAELHAADPRPDRSRGGPS